MAVLKIDKLILKIEVTKQLKCSVLLLNYRIEYYRIEIN